MLRGSQVKKERKEKKRKEKYEKVYRSDSRDKLMLLKRMAKCG
jgi:hypothetical protein